MTEPLIACRGVTYRYPVAAEPVLHDLEFAVIPANSCCWPGPAVRANPRFAGC